MEDEQIHLVEEMPGQLGDGFNFGMELRGILFGKGSTMIYMFRGGFAYHTDSEAEGSELEDVRPRSYSLFLFSDSIAHLIGPELVRQSLTSLDGRARVLPLPLGRQLLLPQIQGSRKWHSDDEPEFATGHAGEV